MYLLQALFIIFFIVFIGIYCGKKSIFNAAQIEGLELLLFKIVLPCYLFSMIQQHDLESLINTSYIYAYLLSFLIISVLTILYYYKKQAPAEICIKILASGYVNAAIYTLPVITLLLGDPKAAILGNLLQVIVIQSLFIIILSFFKHQDKSIGSKMIKIFRSPLVTLPILSLILQYFQLNIPFAIATIIDTLGSGATGVALFTFGLTISHTQINNKNLTPDFFFSIVTKNLLHPFIGILIGLYVFKLENYWLYSLVIATSAPTAFIVYLIAKQFSTDTNFVKTVVTSSSMVSLFMLVFISVYITQFG